jgi:hypothetical protein
MAAGVLLTILVLIFIHDICVVNVYILSDILFSKNFSFTISTSYTINYNGYLSFVTFSSVVF